MTVRELVALLSALPEQDATVFVTYESVYRDIEPNKVAVETWEQGPFLIIDVDTPGGRYR